MVREYNPITRPICSTQVFKKALSIHTSLVKAISESWVVLLCFIGSTGEQLSPVCTKVIYNLFYIIHDLEGNHIFEDFVELASFLEGLGTVNL